MLFSGEPYQVRQVRFIIIKYHTRCHMTYKYETILYWSKEDSAFIAEVPELSGCMAHGSIQ